MPTATDAEVLGELTEGELVVLGRIDSSSNSALAVTVGPDERLAIYKPLDFERPLWDYPSGHLAYRERAAYLISVAGDFDVVPPTVLRDGPYGRGSLQAWVGSLEEVPDAPVFLGEPEASPPGWLPVLAASDERGRDVVLTHADTPALQLVAAFDAVINNSDRKAGHLFTVGPRVRGCDHGVSLGVEPKLRTVLWGFAGRDLPEPAVAALRALSDGEIRGALEAEELLQADELDALASRVDALLGTGRFPTPSPDWPAIPWPPW